MPKLDSDVDLNSDIRILMVEGGSYRGALLRIRILLMVDCFVSFRLLARPCTPLSGNFKPGRLVHHCVYIGFRMVSILRRSVGLKSWVGLRMFTLKSEFC